MNVLDDLKSLSVEEIKELNLSNSIPAAIAMHNVYGNLNLGSIIRTANFLGFREVLYFGRRKWDKRGAVGTYHYTQVQYFENENDFLSTIHDREYNLVALENNVPHTSDLQKFIWPKNPCILVGEENSGLPENILADVYGCVEIPGRGSVRSLNVSTAAAIAMHMLSLEFS